MKSQLEYYLKCRPLSPNATHKVKTYFLFALNSQFVTSNIPTDHDNVEQQKLYLRYKMMKTSIPLGLTKYDINDTFIHIIGMIDHLYYNQLLRARAGFTFKRISTQTFESSDMSQSTPRQDKDEQTILQKLRISR